MYLPKCTYQRRPKIHQEPWFRPSGRPCSASLSWWSAPKVGYSGTLLNSRAHPDHLSLVPASSWMRFYLTPAPGRRSNCSKSLPNFHLTFALSCCSCSDSVRVLQYCSWTVSLLPYCNYTLRVLQYCSYSVIVVQSHYDYCSDSARVLQWKGLSTAVTV